MSWIVNPRHLTLICKKEYRHFAKSNLLFLFNCVHLLWVDILFLPSKIWLRYKQSDLVLLYSSTIISPCGIYYTLVRELRLCLWELWHFVANKLTKYHNSHKHSQGSFDNCTHKNTGYNILRRRRHIQTQWTQLSPSHRYISYNYLPAISVHR